MTTVAEDPLVRLGRWALAKIWFGVVLSGAWALGRHFHWPQAFLTAAAVLGAVGLALASSFLPIWTRQRPSGIPVADVGLRVMVWGGLTVSTIALLVGEPAVGMVAAALLLNTAARTFGDPFGPFLRRLRITPHARWVSPSAPATGRGPHPASGRRSPSADRRSGSPPDSRPRPGAGGPARPPRPPAPPRGCRSA
jgi:hypothetical protein